MTGRRTVTGALALVLAVGAVGLVSVPATATPPQVTVEPTNATTGERLVVTLTGWPAGNVQLEICGNRARQGSVDCAAASARQLYVPGAEPVTSRIVAVAPPVACPCVIRAQTLDNGGGPAFAAGPVTGFTAVGILDNAAPVAPVEPDRLSLRITGLSMEPARQDWRSLFGLGDELLIDVTVQEDGSADADLLQLSVLVGRGEQATTIVDVPAPGARNPPADAVNADAVNADAVRSGAGSAGAGARTVRIAVALDAPVYGRYTVHGQLHAGPPDDRAAPGVSFIAEAERYPWGWPVVAGTFLLVLLLRQLIGLRREQR